jgi:hypothetical protein
MPAATPTWGVAQDGDGTAAGTATPATVGIDMSSATAGAGDTFTVMGAVLTCVASGAGNNEFNAGTGTTLIDNLVTAINRASNTVTIAAQATGWATPKVQDAVFARRNGNNLEIMTRAGSSTYNSSQVAQSGIGGVTGPWTFSGGAGGAWGYAVNGRAVIWPSGVALLTYGTLAGNVLAGNTRPGDVIHYRSARGGNDTYVSTYASVGISLFPFTGDAAQPVIHLIDNGTKWSGDDGTFYLTTGGSNTMQVVVGSASKLCIVQGRPKANDDKSFVYWLRNQYTSGRGLLLGAGSKYKNIEFRTSSSTDGTASYGTFTPRVLHSNGNTLYWDGTTIPFVFEDCTWTMAYANGAGLLRGAAYLHHGAIDFVNNVFRAAANTVAVTAVYIAVGNTTQTKPPHFRFIGGKAYGWVAGCSFLSGMATADNDASRSGVIEIRDFDFGTLQPGTWETFSGTAHISVDTSANSNYYRLSENNHNRFLITSIAAGRRFYYKNATHETSWNPASSWPTLNAQLPEVYGSSQSAWVYRVITNSVSGICTPYHPLDPVRLVKFNTSGQGVKTFTLNYLVDQTIDTVGAPLNNCDVVLEARYVDSTGVVRIERSWEPLQAISAAQNGSTSWSVMSYDISSVRHDYNAKQASLTTTYQVKADSEVLFRVLIGRRSPTVDDWFFVDPEVLFA